MFDLHGKLGLSYGTAARIRRGMFHIRGREALDATVKPNNPKP